MTELSEAVSEKDKIMVVTKMLLNETKWLLQFIGRSKVVAFNANGGAMRSVSRCKTYI
jgi:hypothetical protein